jgi:hypothetical protein
MMGKLFIVTLLLLSMYYLIMLQCQNTVRNWEWQELPSVNNLILPSMCTS